MKIYASVKDQNVKAQLVSQTEDKVTMLVDGEEKEFSMSTFKRWWKYESGTDDKADEVETKTVIERDENGRAVVKKVPVNPVDSTPETTEGSNAEGGASAEGGEADTDGGKADESGKADDVKPTPTKPDKKGRRTNEDKPENPLIGHMKAAVVANGAEVQTTNTKNYFSFVVDGKKFLSMDTSANGIILNVKTAAIANVIYNTDKFLVKKSPVEGKVFDGRVKITSLDDETSKFLNDVILASVKHQRGLTAAVATTAAPTEGAAE